MAPLGTVLSDALRVLFRECNVFYLVFLVDFVDIGNERGNTE